MLPESNPLLLPAVCIASIFLFLLAFLAALRFFYQKKKVLQEQQLKDFAAAYEKNLLLAKLEIQEQSLLDIYSEIHNNIGLSLTLAKLQLNTIAAVNSPETPEKINASTLLIDTAIRELRELSKKSTAGNITDYGLYDVLKTVSEKINRLGNYAVEFSEEGNAVFLDVQKELLLYRIAQEALDNVLKHAAASRIRIRLRYKTDHIILQIKDNGTGFDKNQTEPYRAGSSGITSMRNRSKMLNGTFIITSSAGKGTAVSITAPY